MPPTISTGYDNDPRLAVCLAEVLVEEGVYREAVRMASAMIWFRSGAMTGASRPTDGQRQRRKEASRRASWGPWSNRNHSSWTCASLMAGSRLRIPSIAVCRTSSDWASATSTRCCGLMVR
jgi:hypothetical protein